MADDLTLKVNSTIISGWTSVRVTRGIERMPSDFDISLTERFPDDASIVIAQPGDKCEVLLGSDRVVTGYVDRLIPTIGKANHTLRIVGRSMSQDLVDCSAEWKGGQISGSNALQVAQKLAQPYGITIKAAANPGPVIPQFNMIIGESPFDIIERVCRYSGLLAYDQPDGSVLLAQTGTTKAATGLVQGQNIQSATFNWSLDQSYSEYQVFGLSMYTMLDVGVLNQPNARVLDPNVKRHRLKFFVAESGAAGYELTMKRAHWEMARRHGRSWQVNITADSWRDGAGKLWEPNTLVPVTLPILRLAAKELCVGEVSYLRDEGGTRAELKLMLPDAFLPQPVNILPFIRDTVPPGQN